MRKMELKRRVPAQPEEYFKKWSPEEGTEDEDGNSCDGKISQVRYGDK
jgi:hypothetical protein